MTRKSGISKSGKSGKKTQEIRNQKIRNQRQAWSGKSKKPGPGSGTCKMVGRDFSGLVPENPGPGKIPAQNCRDPDRDSGFFKIYLKNN
jgi:hypothetical protein